MKIYITIKTEKHIIMEQTAIIKDSCLEMFMNTFVALIKAYHDKRCLTFFTIN